MPRRPARRRTCCADSSAATRRQRRPVAAIAAMAWSRRVDFPVPGSPPSRVAEPGNKPPASTRSSSPMPVGMGAWALRSTSLSATGAQSARYPPAAPPAPQAWPTHRAVDDQLLLQRVPLPAYRAAPGPAPVAGAAALATVDQTRTCHRKGTLAATGDGKAMPPARSAPPLAYVRPAHPAGPPAAPAQQ